MPGNRSQKVVEVMRDAPGQLPDGLHFLALHELRLKRFEFGRVLQHRDEGRLACFGYAVE